MDRVENIYVVIYALAGSVISTTPLTSVESSVLIRLGASSFDASMSDVGDAGRFLVETDDVVVVSTSTFSLTLFF